MNSIDYKDIFTFQFNLVEDIPFMCIFYVTVEIAEKTALICILYVYDECFNGKKIVTPVTFAKKVTLL